MRVGVCDFPSAYAFPPHGYGGIERWLWAVAVGAKRAGAEVWLLGPAWRDDLPLGFHRSPVRLEDVQPGDAAFDELKQIDLDLLVVGHEYPSLLSWRATWKAIGCEVAAFQHDPDFQHQADAFDGNRSRLYCYSPEMVERYNAHQPLRTLSVQFGLGEENPAPAQTGADLVWLGRIDGQKVPHLAVRAAGLLGRKIRIIGPVLDQSYVECYREDLNLTHVELVGELAGEAKVDALRSARTTVYTCARDYIEAGAAVFGESLRSGTPVAALVWRSDSCAHAALCAETGAVAEVDPATGDQVAVERLAEAITQADKLDAGRIQMVGMRRFDPARHFRVLAGLDHG